MKLVNFIQEKQTYLPIEEIIGVGIERDCSRSQLENTENHDYRLWVSNPSSSLPIEITAGEIPKGL